MRNKEVSDHVGTRDIGQVKYYAKRLIKKYAENPNAEGAHLLNLIQSKRFKYHWSKEESSKFFEALKQYGKNYTKISEYIGTKTASQSETHGTKLRKKFQVDPSLNGAHLLDILQSPNENRFRRWTDEENTLFFEALDEHGKDYNLISQYIGTKTYNQTKQHGYEFCKKLKGNPQLKEAKFLNLL